MLVTKAGSPDGIQVFEFAAGREYDQHSRPPASADLAAVFVREGWAVIAKEPSVKPSPGPETNKLQSPPSEIKRATRKRGES